MRKYWKSKFILLIFDDVWGLFLIRTFLKNWEAPQSFQNSQIEIGTFLKKTVPLLKSDIAHIFASFFRDAFPQTGFSLHSPRVKFLSEGGVLAFLGDYMVIS